MYSRIITIMVGIALAWIANVNEVLAQSRTNQPDSVKIEKIEIKGNTVFSDSELKQAIDSIEGKTVTLEQLFQIRALHPCGMI